MNLKFTVILFLTGLLCLNTIRLFSQSLILSGQLTTFEGGNPIVGATVSLNDFSKVTTSDAIGFFSFSELTPGKYQLSINFLGFEKITREITVSENSNLKIAMKSVAINLTEVTISPIKSITQSESISKVDQVLRPVNSAQDLLRLVPGLFIAQHAGGGKAEQIFLRGFDSDHGTDFNISVDGMPVNMVSHAHGQGYADFHFVIPETIDHLNVYKGPYNAMFGDFATSGTGAFFTKNSIDKNEVKLEAGMFDTYRALSMIKLLDKKHFLSSKKENAYVAGEYVFTNSYFDNKQKFNRYNVFGKYAAMLNDKNYLTFSASAFAARWDASGQIPQRMIDAGLIDRFGSIDPSEGGQTHRNNFNGMLTTTTANNYIIKNQIYFVNYYFNLYSNFTFFLNDSVHGDEINQTDNRNIFGYNGSIQKNYLINNKIIHASSGIGIRNDIADISLKHAQQRVLLDTIVAGRVNQQNASSYFDFTFDVNKHFSINAGTRLDFFQFRFTDNSVDSLTGKKEILRASPKLNFYYSVNDNLQFFLKSGIGFHSNDARAVVINHVNNSLPKAYGSEIGSDLKLSKRILVNIAFWGLYLESELIYIGDEATVETNFPTQRAGMDLSVRYQVTSKIFADVDLNYNKGKLVGAPKGENHIPLAPHLTSIGGLTYKQEKGLNGSLRYRFIDSRPGNETNSVIAKGYFLMDAVVAYKFSKIEVGFSVENLLNTTWNQAQFDTESRLFNEAEPVSELHFTPGTPIFFKANVSVKF